MLWLVFQVGADRYALRGGDVIEVLPLVELHRPAHAPPGFAGVFTYRGAVLPVIDLPRLLTGAPCPCRLHSRVILVRLPAGPAHRPVGLLAERVTDLREVTPRGAAFPGVASAEALPLGPVVAEEQGLIHLLDVGRLRPEWIGEC